MVADAPVVGRAGPGGGPGGPGGPVPVRLADVERDHEAVLPTGVPELDRVLGGGLAPGSVTLLGGEPGMGKSTLVLQALGRLAASGARCLLVSAEESAVQVHGRAERVGSLRGEIYLLSETSLPAIVAHAAEVAPHVVAVDSVQTVVDPDQPGVAGSVSQVREGAQRLVRLAKETGVAVLLVGHVTKEGGLAGPRLLEHVVDTVLAFEGDRHQSLRTLHALKHRFGSTQELGLFEMADDGLHTVADPSALFLADRRPGTPGSVVAPIVEGARPLLVEVQALVAANRAPTPRRSAQGVDARRLAMVLAVLERHAGVDLAGSDVFASVAGGVRAVDPGADLALALALASARSGVPVDPALAAVGEVGLGGEVRQARQAPRRIAEAVRLGFRRVLVPASTPVAGAPAGVDLIPVSDVGGALGAVS